MVNALSSWLEVVVDLDGKSYRQRYERGKAVMPLTEVGTAERTGSTVTFLPDDTIFEETVFDYDILKERLRETAFLTKGLKINLTDKREEQERTKTFHYEGGIKEYVQYLNRGRTALYPEIIYCEGKKDETYVEVAIQHNDTYTESCYSFVNNIITPEGGTHFTGFKNALTKTFNAYARQMKYLKENEQPLSGEDIREGISAIISIKLPEPQ